tara:strand:+ start:40 stop:456 length:417 start_codon:yes stop_codon:yes gene_type:complete
MKILKILLLTNLIFTTLEAKTNFFDEGIIFYKNKQLNKAKFKFEQDIVFNPKNEKSYLYLSKIFNKQNKKDLEEKNLNTVILLNPKNEEATYNLAELRLKESDFSGSGKLINRLLVFCKDYCQKAQKLKAEIDKALKK